MSKIYTKAGDAGTTGTLRWGRLSKAEAVFELVGTLDELNSFVGLAASLTSRELLEPIQHELFEIGFGLMSGDAFDPQAARAAALERHIDRLEAENPPLTHFILPGGSTPAAMIHCARAVCRRAERLAVRHAAPADVLRYLNRLSDLLFVLARRVNDQPERIWQR